MARRAARLKPPKSGSAWDRINPYVGWALGPGRSQYFVRQERGEERMPLLLRLKGPTAQEFLDGVFIASAERRKRWQESFRVLCRPKDKFSSVWVSSMATLEIVQRMSSRVALFSIESVSLGRPLDTQGFLRLEALPKAALQRRVKAPKTRALRAAAPTVVMGVIDDGIAFANERFQKIVGAATPTSRVEYCLLMDLPVVHTKSAIDLLLAQSGGDEEVLYRRAKLFDFVNASHNSAALRTAHGTHVMDLACGFDPMDNRDDRPIVCVQLPIKVTADKDPGDLYVWAAMAIDFIVNRALQIAISRGVANLPVVINLSYGLLADPHDGTGLLEAFIDAKIKECKDDGFDLRVVLPAGNGYLSRTHGQASLSAGRPTETFHWRVLPDDRTPSFLEIWMPDPLPTASRVTLTITSPTGASWTILELQSSTVYFGLPGPIYGEVTSSSWPVNNPTRTRFIIILHPTAQPDPPIPQLAPAGIWQVQLTRTDGLTSSPRSLVHAWVRRDDQVYGFPIRGRQSYLDHPDYTRFDHAGRDEEYDDPSNPPTLVKHESTLNSIATGTEAIVLGGYLGKERLPAKYSAAGAVTGMLPPPPTPPPPVPIPLPPPTFPTTPRWPDAMAVSEDSRVHTGVLAAGSRSGSVVAMGGTSVAAPQVARWVADELAAGNSGNRLAVQTRARPPTGIALPQPERSGQGGIKLTPIVNLKRFEWP